MQKLCIVYVLNKNKHTKRADIQMDIPSFLFDAGKFAFLSYFFKV